MHHSHRSFPRAAVRAVLLFLGGCIATPALRPPGLPSASLTMVNSVRVSLHQVRFEEEAGRLLLCGYVFRYYPAAAEDTSKTHLQLTLFNAKDEPLKDLSVGFTPSQIPLGAHHPGYSVFSVPLDVLPEGTKRIQIRADDSPTPL